MPCRPSFVCWTASSEDGCARSCAGGKSGAASVSVPTTINAGQTPTSQVSGCSRRPRLDIERDFPDEETNDWRAVCGRTASTVRREGRREPFLPPIAVPLPAKPKLFRRLDDVDDRDKPGHDGVGSGA